MELFGVIKNDKVSIFVDEEKVKNNNLFVFIKGKIFNFDELVKKYKIKVNNENELISELYTKDGVSFIDELDGNFCIIIYDYKINKIFLLRDKLGSEPIYYYTKDNLFMVSTSLKKLEENEFFVKKINKQALSNYLGYMYIYEPLTIFEDTYKVEAGCILCRDSSNIEVNRYFDLAKLYKKTKRLKHVSEEELINNYTKLFKKSLLRRGNRNSSVGILMSSGKDSTLLAKLSSMYFHGNINTYTLGFENERDESKGANAIANYIKSNHHLIPLHDKDVLKTIKEMPKYYDEPFADPSIIPSMYLASNIHDDNDFYITGEGNDAVFLNSSMYNIYNFSKRIKLYVKKLINIYNHKRVYHNFSEMAQVNILGRFNYSDKITGIKGKVYKLSYVRNRRMRAMIGDLKHTVPEKYKAKTKSIMKFYNNKCYTPYYDLDVITYLFKTPINKVYKNNHGKYIFEKVLYKNIPKEYYEKYKKNGFGVPLTVWVKKIMLNDIKTLSKKKTIDKKGLFNYDELTKLILDFEENSDYNKACVLWCYYIFQLWYQENIEKL